MSSSREETPESWLSPLPPCAHPRSRPRARPQRDQVAVRAGDQVLTRRRPVGPDLRSLASGVARKYISAVGAPAGGTQGPADSQICMEEREPVLNPPEKGPQCGDHPQPQRHSGRSRAAWEFRGRNSAWGFRPRSGRTLAFWSWRCIALRGLHPPCPAGDAENCRLPTVLTAACRGGGAPNAYRFVCS